MPRNLSLTAVVLRQRQIGDKGREAFFLTDEGIIRAMVWGGAKSKLRSFVSPYHSGMLYLYHDPVRDTYKVSDFDVASWRLGIRENFERTMTAAAVAETILCGHGGGCDSHNSFILANRVFDALDNASGKGAAHILVWFFWMWAGILGVRPELTPSAAVNPQALRWLNACTAEEPPRYALDDISLNGAKHFCMDILSKIMGRGLKSWTW